MDFRRFPLVRGLLNEADITIVLNHVRFGGKADMAETYENVRL